MQVESFSDGSTLGCVSVGLNWPEIADALAAFSPWKLSTKYPILTRGDVLKRYFGDEHPSNMEGFDIPAF